LKRQT